MADTKAEFTLDRFQREAVLAIDAGSNVLVAAPTGSGKTVVAEHAITRMLDQGERSFYTSPIKALANQKYRNFCDKFGAEQVGLLTGDLTVRPSAAIIVMTTEVLRNMLYEQARSLTQLGCVVFDEVHYLQDRHRGPVWEEVLLHLDRRVQTVSLSATVSNLDEFVGWLRSVRGDTALVVETERPVPLDRQLATLVRETGAIDRVPLLKKGRLSPQARAFMPTRESRRQDRGGRSRTRGRGNGRDRGRDRGRVDRSASGDQGRSSRPHAPPRRSELCDDLTVDNLGPIIWFVFSRAGCDEAVEQCVNDGLVFTNDDQANALSAILDDATVAISDDDWDALGLERWARAFTSGITSHHAGLVPALKDAVEIAFADGLISVVFATETLALGVNLPARTVVLERLVKYNGETHELLTPLEFTQLTGRAGRRGLDTTGNVVICWNNRADLESIAALATSTDFPLFSAFAPSYNMVANLIRRMPQEAARSFVNRSFAQYQRDASTSRARADIAELNLEVELLHAQTRCDRGDLDQYMRDSERAGDDELATLRPGDVIVVDADCHAVVSVAHRGGGVVVHTINAASSSREWRAGSIPRPVEPVSRIDLPVGFVPRSEQHLQQVANQVVALDVVLPGVAGCPRLSEHLAALDEHARLTRRRDKLQRRTDKRSERMVTAFDAVVDALTESGFVDGWKLTRTGALLAGLFGDCEAVLASGVDNRVFDGLDEAELASVLSAAVYEPRGSGPAPAFRWPTKRVRRAVLSMQQEADRIGAVERRVIGETLTRRPDAGVADIAYRWASGDPLAEVIADELLGGDFVRIMRQTIDLCRQVAAVAPADIAEVAVQAVHALDRGVVRSGRDLPFLELAAVGDDAADVSETPANAD